MDGSAPAAAVKNAPASYKHITVHPIAGSMGAEVRGADLAALDDATFAEINDAFLRHQVIFLRDQHITPDQQVAFARRFGEIHHHPYMKSMDDYPDIFEIVKNPGDTHTFGAVWHTDQQFNPQPAKLTMLYALEVPRAGGDTMFANMYDAYDALSDGMKDMLKDVKTWCTGDRDKLSSGRAARSERYAGNKTMAAKLKDPGNLVTECAHPLIRTHPETGRKALYIGNHARGLDRFNHEEAVVLLEFLRRHSERPEFTCRVRWEPGTITLWDNRCVQHYAVPDYDERRRMHRITVCGDTPF